MNIAVVLDIPQGGDQQTADNGKSSHQDEEVIPAEMVGEPAQACTGDHHAAVAHQPNDAHEGQNNTKVRVGNTLLGRERRHRKGKVLANEIEHRVAPIIEQMMTRHCQYLKECLVCIVTYLNSKSRWLKAHRKQRYEPYQHPKSR